MENRVEKRIQWIDAAKTIAIIAVVADHCNGLLYTNQLIAMGSYFSVTLFVLLSGITANQKAKKPIPARGGVCLTLTQYALAVFILQIWYNRFFDLKVYISHLLNFSIQGPYYFLLFFLQLRMISPFLSAWCRFCGHSRYKCLLHFVTTAFLCWFSSILIRYTSILPVHGGGKYLFGGTYLLVYYAGMQLEDFGCFYQPGKIRRWLLLGSGIFWLFWWQMMCVSQRKLDQYLLPYWGDGFNPPSVNFIVFGLATLFFLYAAFTLLEEAPYEWANILVGKTAQIGRYTLYIFMYHLLVRDVLITLFPVILENIWVLRVCVFLPMILLPAVVAAGIRKLCLYYEGILQ